MHTKRIVGFQYYKKKTDITHYIWKPDKFYYLYIMSESTKNKLVAYASCGFCIHNNNVYKMFNNTEVIKSCFEFPK